MALDVIALVVGRLVLMALDVIALVVGRLVLMGLDVLVHPSLAVLILHRTSSFRTFFRTCRNLIT
jgi:hypothetical protein